MYNKDFTDPRVSLPRTVAVPCTTVQHMRQSTPELSHVGFLRKLPAVPVAQGVALVLF